MVATLADQCEGDGRADISKGIMGAPNTKQSTTLRYSRLLSFISITVSLFMLGALGLVYALEQGLNREVRERVSFTVELPREGGVTPEEAVAQLRALPYVRQVELISSKVHLQAAYTHPDSLRMIARQSPLLRTAEELNDQEGQWASATENLQTIRMVLWCFLILNLLVSFLQINTATGLVIYSQRMRIRTLSLIGATASFIGRPFVLRAMLDGFLGALVALALLGGSLYGICRGFGFDLLAYCPLLPIIGVALVIPLVGVSVSFVSSWRATRKYIHMDEGKIHLI